MSVSNQRKNQRWFTLKLDEEWEPLKIICRVFDTDKDLQEYKAKFTDEDDSYAPAFTIGFKHKDKYNKIEMCLSEDFLSLMVFAHEIAHMTHMYTEHYIPEEAESDLEEWFCVVNGWLTEEFHNRFNKVFDIVR